MLIMNTKHKFNDMTNADADVEKYYIWRILISLQKIKRMKHIHTSPSIINPLIMSKIKI